MKYHALIQEIVIKYVIIYQNIWYVKNTIVHGIMEQLYHLYGINVIHEYDIKIFNKYGLIAKGIEYKKHIININNFKNYLNM